MEKIWNWLVIPNTRLQRPDERRQARLLASLLLFLIALGIVMEIITTISSGLHGPRERLYRTGVALGGLLISYALTRAGHYKIAVRITVSIVSIMIFVTARHDGNEISVYFLNYTILPVLFSSIFTSLWTTLVVIVVNLLGLLLFWFLIPQVSFWDTPVGFYSIFSGLILLAAYHRNRLEQDRQAKLAQLLRTERKQRELTEALEEAAAAISGTLDVEQVLDRILEQVQRVVVGDAVNVMLIEEQQVARIVRWRGYERLGLDDSVGRTAIPITKYASLSHMMRAGEPVLIHDTAADPDWIAAEGQEWRRSYVAAPIRMAGHTVGFLNSVSRRPHQFDANDAQRLMVFANHAATAIENARLHRELREYAQSLEQRVQERTAQLTDQYARLQAILHSVSDGIVVTDEQGGILQTNPVAQGWLTRHLSPEDAARLREAVQQLACVAPERPETMVELSGLDLELQVAPISEPETDRDQIPPSREIPPSAVVVIHDVGHLKLVDRMKTRFVANISHALRTPVANVKLYADLLKREPPLADTAYYLQVLEQQADQLMHIIQDILDVTALDRDRAPITREPVPLPTLVQDAVKRYQGQAETAGLALTVLPIPPETPTVKGDPAWLFRGLCELVENAVTFVPPGGRVTVQVRTVKEDGQRWVKIAVRDDGPGISAEEQAQIFERFYRGSLAESGHTPGSGLGLSIAQEIVQAHGGRVTVESEPGSGSTFTIWLPSETSP